MELDNLIKGYSKRVLIISFLAIALTALLLSTLWKRQIDHGDEYRETVRKMCLRRSRIKPVRGRILSSDGVILANTSPVFNIIFHFNEMRQPGRTANTHDYVTKKILELQQYLKKQPLALERKVLTKTFKQTFDSASPLSETEFKKYFSTTTLSKDFFDSIPPENVKLAWKRINSELNFANGIEEKCSASHKAYFRAFEFARQVTKRLHRLTKVKDKAFKLTPDQLWEKLRDHSNHKWRSQLTYNFSDTELIFLLGGKKNIIKQTVSRHSVTLPYLAFSNINAKQLGLVSELMPTPYNKEQTHNNSMGAIPGLEVEISYQRSYDHPLLASHLLGYTTEMEVEKGKDSFTTREPKGQYGLELKYNSTLAGKAGHEIFEVDLSRYTQSISTGEKATNGNELVLNIDAQLQHAAITSFTEHNPGKSGAVVVLDCNSGAILAMASLPNYDLSKIATNLSELTKQKEKPLMNRAVSENYEPGSTVKPLIALAAFNNNIVSPDYIHDCDGYTYFDERRMKFLRCAAINRGGHGETDVVAAIEQSCNPYFTDIGTKTGLDKIKPYFAMAGFGKRTGVDLPLEAKGILPSREQKYRDFKQRWNISDTGFISIGKVYIKTTPLQMARYAAAIANGGTLYQPQLVDKIVNQQGETVTELKPKVNGKIDTHPAYLDVIREGMHQVVWGENAGAKRAQSEVITLAGKTGTAVLDKATNRRNTWFICFGPVENPKYACAVLVINGHYGGTSAAPVAKNMFEKWLGDKNDL